jgi:formate dehydrogenase major subunit
MYIMGENPAMSDPDVDHAREALAALDHLVVQDIFYRDRVSGRRHTPATAWPEKDGTVTNTDRMVQLGRKALDPPGDARGSLIINEMAAALALTGYSHQEKCSKKCESAWIRSPALRDRLERVERRIHEKRAIQANPSSLSRFPTPTGRGQFVPRPVSPGGA